jgi:hypothetical protein
VKNSLSKTLLQHKFKFEEKTMYCIH